MADDQNNFSGQDEQIDCKDCRQQFTFSVGEQVFFTRKGFKERPKRCKTCREKRDDKKGGSAPKQERHEATAPRGNKQGRGGRQRGRDRESIWER